MIAMANFINDQGPKEAPTFDQLPEVVLQIREGISELKMLLLGFNNPSILSTDTWFDLNGLVDYDPEKRSKPTFYGYIHERSIPFHKRGKKITFLKSEIDTWLKTGRRKTNEEIISEADQFLVRKKGLNHGN